MTREDSDDASRVGPGLTDLTSTVLNHLGRWSLMLGHGQHIPQLGDLQYARTFPLPKPRACLSGDVGCDCSPYKAGSSDAVVTANSPICHLPRGGPVATTHCCAKAYPETRQLQFLRDLGSAAIVQRNLHRALAGM